MPTPWQNNAYYRVLVASSCPRLTQMTNALSRPEKAYEAANFAAHVVFESTNAKV
jgi:hypothetical protein